MTRAYLSSLALASFAGCGAEIDMSATPSTAESPCAQAELRLGDRACVELVESAAIWSAIAAPSSAGQPPTTGYLVPAARGARLPTLLEDQKGPARSHFDLLTKAFPDLFPGLTLDELDAITIDPTRREFFTGVMNEYADPDGTPVYGYRIWDTQVADGTVTCADAQLVYAALNSAFTPTPLVILPSSTFQRDMLAGCPLPSFDAGAP